VPKARLEDLTREDWQMATPEERELITRFVRRQNAQSQEKFSKYFPDEDIEADGRIVFHARHKYEKHITFFDAGAKYPERLFMAANRVGKTDAGAFEVTAHTTGRYPDWWHGRQFDKPGEWWACGTNSETLRDIVQVKLFGPWENVTQGRPLSGGMMPADAIVGFTRRAHGPPGSLESVTIKHANGGFALIGLKMYEAGRKSFEGTEKQGIWCDEEPPEDIYTEMLFRTMTTGGITIVTFTPLQGMSNVVAGFLTPPNEEAKKFKTVINAGWDHVPHLTEDAKAHLLATTPPFQRDARSKGIPQLGAGAIYQFSEDALKVNPFELPRHYKRWFSLDAGGGAGPTAMCWWAQDPVTDVKFIYDVYKRESPELALHFAALEARGRWIPGVGDAAALVINGEDAEQLVKKYQQAKFDLILADKAVEAGIQDVWEAMTAGRLKVFAHCTPWFDEFRLYHRDEKGRIVKKNDHLMDATRYGARPQAVLRAKTPRHDEDQRDRLKKMALPTGGSWMGR
jgi:phage terminase large subunit-like protein